MRKTITILAALACAASLFAQPQLNKDNVEEVLLSLIHI